MTANINDRGGLSELDPATQAILDRFGFDRERFEHLRDDVVSGRLSVASNVIEGGVEPPMPADIVSLPQPGTAEAEGLTALGADLLRAGKVAHVVLAGGMATRFGGVVKALVDVVAGRSFLELALGATAHTAHDLGAPIPTLVMSSFATDADLRATLPGLDLPEPRVFSQFVSLRLEPDGSIFREQDGRVSLYATGHGDLFEALERSGALAELRSTGVEHLLVANVDNLGARLDPLLVGLHASRGTPLTIEVARKLADTGGAPARVDGRLRLVEGPCFPPDFPQETIPVFNTNTALVRLAAIDPAPELSWLVALKHVDGRPALQLERLYHELSAHVETTYVEVPRSGIGGRFFPVKEPSDLERVRDEVLANLPPGS